MNMKNGMTAQWKKRLLTLAVIISCLAILATGTAAYFVAEETAYNVITTGLLHMELIEETTGGKPWPADGVMGVMPSTDVDKVVYVRNRGNVPFYARIQMEQRITAAPGTTAELTFEHITLDLNTECWIEQGGFYYYYRAIQPGEVSEPLFTTVSFAPQMGNEYMNATVEIAVQAQAVQSDNNGYDPLFALGWSEPAKELIQNADENAE
ncbi:MAG: hypothetical protein IKL25_08665 [Clostridia bacterium]|nr:hypothetical protein [Clostridia bacterium]